MSKFPISWRPDPTLKPATGEHFARAPAGANATQSVLRLLSRCPIPGQDVVAVDEVTNPDMVDAFHARLAMLQTRSGNPPFQPKFRQQDMHIPDRELTLGALKLLSVDFSDSEFPDVNIVPVWHGTTQAALPSIMRGSFANLASTDSGFFGKGIYGTPDAEYSYRCYAKPSGVLMMCFFSFYSAYPVCGCSDMTDKLEGRGSYQNYDAHIVTVVPKDPMNPQEVNYYPAEAGMTTTGRYMELVVFESAQALPGYIVVLRPSTIPRPPPKVKGVHGSECPPQCRRLFQGLDADGPEAMHVLSLLSQNQELRAQTEVGESTRKERRHLLLQERIEARAEQYIKSSCDVVIGPQIGEGAFGIVHRATYMGQEVAVKRLRSNEDALKTGLKKEALTMIRIASPYVVRVFGILDHPMGIIMEMVPNGTLYSLLREPNEPLSTHQVFNICRGITSGLKCLHDSNVLHCDLKGLNILIDDNLLPKITDFGLSKTRIQATFASATHAGGGTFQWMSPELHENPHSFSVASDTYALGMVFYEIVTRSLPWEEELQGKPSYMCVHLTVSNKRPKIPDNVHHCIASIIVDCWQQNPADRPTLSNILDRLAQGIQSVPQSLKRRPLPTPCAVPAHSDQLQLGIRIRIEGLLARPELNGSTAVICGDFDPSNQRWTVRLDVDNSIAQLLTENIKIIPANDSSGLKLASAARAWCEAKALHYAAVESFINSKKVMLEGDPFWSPKVAACQLCSTKFGLTTMRHHCRVCGVVACDACSRHRKRGCETCRAWVESSSSCSCSSPKLSNLRMCKTCHLQGGLNSTSISCQSQEESRAANVKKLEQDVVAAGGATHARALLVAGCSIDQIKNAKLDSKIASLKQLGCDARILKDAGADLLSLKNAGFDASSLILANFDVSSLLAAGIQLSDLKSSIVSASALKSAGCSLQSLKSVGYDAASLKDAGFELDSLKSAGFSVSQLHAAGFNSIALKTSGFSVHDLKSVGLDAASLRAAGFPLASLKAANYTIVELRSAGFDPMALRSVGFDMSALLDGGYDLAALKASGCDASSMKKLGSSAVQLRAVGFDAVSLKLAGYDASNLHAAGFDVIALKSAGCSAVELKKLGYDALALKTAGYSLTMLRDATYGIDSLRHCGFDVIEFRTAGFIATELKAGGFDIRALKSAGFDSKTLRSIGYSVLEIFHCGCDAFELKTAGFDATALKSCGFDVMSLKSVGFDAAALKTAGYDAVSMKAAFDAFALKAAGFDAPSLRVVGFSAEDLKTAGFSAKALSDSGFGLQALKDALFTASDLKGAGFDVAALRDVGFDATEMKTAGFDAAALRNVQYSVKLLKQAGFNALELKNGGFDAQVLKESGFDAFSLKSAGFDAATLSKCGFGLSSLKTIGFDVAALKTAGYDAVALKEASFDAGALKAGGFSSLELQSASFDLASLRHAGFDAVALKTCGYDAAVLKGVGFDCFQLVSAGFDLDALIKGGFSLAELKYSGIEASELIRYGYDLQAFKLAGFEARSLMSCGFDLSALKQAGFDAVALRSAGFDFLGLRAAGFEPVLLKAAGFTVDDFKRNEFDSQSLKSLGFNAFELKEGGFDAKALKDSGFDCQSLKDATFSVASLKDVGFDAVSMKAVGFSCADLKEAGFSIESLKAAGFGVKDLKKSDNFGAAHLKSFGFSAASLKADGCNLETLRAIGFDASELPSSAIGYNARELKDVSFDRTRNPFGSLTAPSSNPFAAPSSKGSNPFAPSSNPFAPSSNPFAPSSNPFAPSSNPFAPSSNPFAPSSNPFAPSSNPFAPSSNPFGSLTLSSSDKNSEEASWEDDESDNDWHRKCPRGHALVSVIGSPYPGTASGSCNLCKSDLERTVKGNLHCRFCNFDVCRSCWSKCFPLCLNTADFPMFPGRDSGCDTLYCHRVLGPAAIPHSDGQCGPTDGPQCSNCKAATKFVVGCNVMLSSDFDLYSDARDGPLKRNTVGTLVKTSGSRHQVQYSDSLWWYDSGALRACGNSERYRMCPSGHKLKSHPYKTKRHSCDLCGTSISSGQTGRRCQSCDYDLCPSCSHNVFW